MRSDWTIYIENRQRKYPLSKRQVEGWVREILWMEGIQSQGEQAAEVGLLFVNNRVMQDYNRLYRGQDAPTDVLSFPLLTRGRRQRGEAPVPLLGDLVISLEKVYEEAPLFGRKGEEQTLFVIIHGLLHLLGYDHERSRKEAAQMRRREKTLLTHFHTPAHPPRFSKARVAG